MGPFGLIAQYSLLKVSDFFPTRRVLAHREMLTNRYFTFTQHFITCNLLVQGWTFFWTYSSEILVHIDMLASHSCCRFDGCTSIMRISTTSQKSSVGSGDCGGQFSAVNSLSYSRNLFEVILTSYAALSCRK